MSNDRNELLRDIAAAIRGEGGGGGGASGVSKEYVDGIKEDLELQIAATSTLFVGEYPTLDDLNAAHPARAVRVGSWAIVNPVGVDEPSVTYTWDNDTATWSSTVESVVPVPRNPKYAILPIAGQSNAQGFGETAYDIRGSGESHPRIWQLGRYATGATNGGFTATQEQFNYEDLFAELRPYGDCNLQLIPAMPCLDHIQNPWTVQVGGLSGFGLNTAKKLLEMIPSDYDIIIVPCARGGSRFIGGVAGTYDAVNKRASQSATLWGVTSNLYQDFKDRVSHCLDLSPDTLLLPVLWAQGEFDASDDAVGHKPAFEAMFDDFYAHIRDNYADRCVDGDINNFRWMCLSSTKWMWGANLQTDFKALDSTGLNQLATSYGNSAAYINYVELQREKLNDYGESLIRYVRIDIKEDGKFTQTNRERGNGSTTATREIHFSTHAVLQEIPRLIEAALRSSGGMPLPNAAFMWTRSDKLTLSGEITTNNMESFKAHALPKGLDNTNLILHQNFATAATFLSTEALGTGVSLSSSGGGLSLQTRPNIGQVLEMLGSGYLTYVMPRVEQSYTRCVVVKQPLSARSKSGANILSSATQLQQDNGILWSNYGRFSAYADYTDREGTIVAWSPAEIMTTDPYTDGFYHLCVVYNHEAKTILLYVNGNAVSKRVDVNSAQGNMNLGNYNASTLTDLYWTGDIASVRIYDKALDPAEIAYLAEVDLFGKYA